MQAVNVIGLMNHIDEVITALGESGVFHPDEVNNFYKDLGGFTHLQSNNSYAEPLTNLKVALNRTKRSFPLTDTGDFNPTFEELDSFSAATAAQIDALTDKKIETQARLNEARQNLSVAEHFSGLAPDVQEALKLCRREDLIGYGPKCLIRPKRDGEERKRTGEKKHGGGRKPNGESRPPRHSGR